jgi:predicted negative regulator of RcsB-dependent stress response
VINDHLGDAYWKVGRHHEARFQWKRALALGPEDDAVSKIRLKLVKGLTAEAEPQPTQ